MRTKDVLEVGPLNFTIDGAPVDRDYAYFDKYCAYLPALGVAKNRIFTGWVYEIPEDRQLVHACGIDFVEIPVYDSPCVLTERSAIDFVAGNKSRRSCKMIASLLLAVALNVPEIAYPDAVCRRVTPKGVADFLLVISFGRDLWFAEFRSFRDNRRAIEAVISAARCGGNENKSSRKAQPNWPRLSFCVLFSALSLLSEV